MKGRVDAVVAVVGGCQRDYFGWRISGGRKVFFRLDLVRRTRESWAVYSADEVTSSTSQIHSPKKSKGVGIDTEVSLKSTVLPGVLFAAGVL